MYYLLLLSLLVDTNIIPSSGRVVIEANTIRCVLSRTYSGANLSCTESDTTSAPLYPMNLKVGDKPYTYQIGHNNDVVTIKVWRDSSGTNYRIVANNQVGEGKL